jgi:hypothetical protein
LLTFVGANLFDRLVEHLRSEYTIRFEIPVVGGVVIAMQFELPLFTCDPGQNPALDHSQIGRI